MFDARLPNLRTFTVVSTVDALRAQLRTWRMAGDKIAFVPTMGNLHEGHLSLVHTAHTRAQRVVASIFVNPTQFGPGEDYLSYPRTMANDQALLEGAQCDLLFAPGVSEMYRAGTDGSLRVDVGTLGSQLCGAVRPGHFSGVATVVAKLFNLVQPDVAVFGEKDFQQLMVIRRLVAEFDFPVEIVGAPTARAPNGLALSSRNQYLSEEEVIQAALIHATLLQMRDSVRAGQSPEIVEQAALTALTQAGFHPDYAALRDAQSLELIKDSTTSVVALIAARLGKARLIDNLAFSRA